MAEQLRKRIEALKSRKTAVEDGTSGPQQSGTSIATAATPASSILSSSSAATGKSAQSSVSLANLPPAFVSPYTAVVKYRDTVNDPLCTCFTTRHAVDLFKMVVQSSRNAAVAKGLEPRKRSRSEDEDVASERVQHKVAMVKDGDEKNRERSYLLHEGGIHVGGDSHSTDNNRGSDGGVDNTSVDATNSKHCTAVSHFLPYLESRYFTHSEVKGGEGRNSDEPPTNHSHSSVQRDGGDLKTVVSDGDKYVEVSGRMRAPCRSVNEYDPVSRIAHGVYGVVFCATEARRNTSEKEGEGNRKNGKKFALKQVRKHWLAESQVGFPPYLLREFDLLLRLRHPNIVSGREVVLLDKKCESSKYSARQEEGQGVEKQGSALIHSNCKDDIKEVKVEVTATKNSDNGGTTLSRDGEKSEQDHHQRRLPRPSDNTNDVYLVMEYCPYDLKSFIYGRHKNGVYLHLTSRNRHPEAARCFLSRVKCIIKQLFTALSFLHDHRILHRDIKASNILISSKGVVKLCDFGLGRLYREGQGLTSNVVTLMYRAPELHFGVRDYSHKMDVWSLACIMAEIFLKEPLFRAEEESRHFAVICDVIGIPTEETFSGLYKIPDVTRLMRSLKRYNRENTLRQLFALSKHAGAATMPPSGFDLLHRILRWNPLERLSAWEVLQHEFFHEEPLPCSPEELLVPLPTTEVEPTPAASKVERQNMGESEADRGPVKDTHESDSGVCCSTDLVAESTTVNLRADSNSVSDDVAGEHADRALLRDLGMIGSEGCNNSNDCKDEEQTLQRVQLLANQDCTPSL
uniref:Protein kinase domain-containing protein n=1 Tax=Trypanosoma congolense (strain IL3000) TaxID=1068625 RepID=G0UJF6_TRYCI|nr:putative protein kinase [Trypanosoma congolense IL3000]